MRSPRGQITRLDANRWVIRVEGGKDPKTGKRHRPSKTIRGTKQDAERVRIELLAKIGETTEARESMTLDDFFYNLYLPDCIKRLRPTTVVGYESHYRVHLQTPLGGSKLEKITPLKITRWIASRKTPSQKFESYKLLRQILARAERWDLIDNNPCRRVDIPKKPKYRPETLTAKEALAYLEHFKGHRVETAVLIIIGGALRRSELIALDWRDISYDGAVTIDDAITDVHGKPHRDKTKTEFSERVVHLPEAITRRLNELRQADHIPVVADLDNSRSDPNWVSRQYSRHVKTLPPGIKRVSLKNLRHTSLSLAIESGTDIYAVSRRAGHASIEITSQYYLRTDKSVDIAAASNLDSYLNSQAQ